MANKINYNSEEVAEARSILNESVNILDSELLTTLSSSFNVLSELGLFSDGLAKLKSQIETLMTDHQTFASSLESHDNDLSTFEGTQATAINQYINGGGTDKNYYSGSDSTPQKIEIATTAEGTKISNNELKEIADDISYVDKLKILKNIMNAKGLDTTYLSTDEDKSNFISSLLKQISNDNSIEISDNKIEYEKLIEDVLLESITSEDKNGLAKLDEETAIQGVTYLKEVANSNNIDFSSLVLDDKYSDILMESIKNMYNGDSDAMLTTSEISNFKNYIDTIASSNNMTADELLSNKNNIDLIKGGMKK
jgi:hypothetical protein